MNQGEESATATPAIEAAMAAPPADASPAVTAAPIEPSIVATAPHVEAPKIEIPKIEPPAVEAPAVQASASTAGFEPRIEIPKIDAAETAPVAAAPGFFAHWNAARTHRYAPLAAAVVIAVLGVGVGSAMTAVLSSQPPAPGPQTAAINDSRALKETVVRLSSELATVKASVETGHRSASTQFGKIADRLDRAEKAQADPTAKLAKIAEAVDRLERRPVPTPTAVAALPSPPPDITNSIPAPAADKKPAKPPVIEGWTLVEFGNGRAVVESRAGGLFEVGPGSTLPGVGKVESIKREDGRVVISTPKGLIVSMVEPRRSERPYYPQRY